jgi:hypothetical protein
VEQPACPVPGRNWLHLIPACRGANAAASPPPVVSPRTDARSWAGSRCKQFGPLGCRDQQRAQGLGPASPNAVDNMPNRSLRADDLVLKAIHLNAAEVKPVL